MAYTTQKPEGYVPRLVDRVVASALEDFGAVEVRGIRWCGKSWTSMAFSESVVHVDENLDVFREQPSLALLGPDPHAVDEWQTVPAIWNLVKHRVDENGRPGQFILTGSSTPPDVDGLHSGAGRICKVRMTTMTLLEKGVSSGSVSLRGLFDGMFEPCPCGLGLDVLASEICRGGWPGLIGASAGRSSRMIDSYLDALFDVSMKQSGKDPFASRRIAESLARGLGTTMGLGVISQDASQGTEGLYDPRTISSYLAEMESNYFICDVPGWDAPVKSRSRIRKKPKRYFDDPSLAAALLGFDAGRLLEDGQTFGVLFENLVAHELRAFLSTWPEATSESLRYYGDADGLEVDFIIELRDGRWAAMEVKLGESKVDKAAESLTRLERKVLANPMARNPEPAFKAVVVGHAGYAYRRDSDGVYVLPIGVLAP